MGKSASDGGTPLTRGLSKVSGPRLNSVDIIDTSPILANVFMHHAFDLWMVRTHPDLPWCRNADAGLVHCRNEQEAEALKVELQARLAECHLEMHPTKTTVVYCKDGKRKGKYPNVKFEFLGYRFRPRLVRNSRKNSLFCGFNPAVSPSAMKTMRQAIRDLNLRRQTQLSLQDIARQGIMGAMHTRRCIPCCGMSIRRSYLGRDASSSAFSATRSRPVGLFNG